jgi:predicted ArsR family transcriptional regulator
VATARQRILEFIQNHRTATAAEISQAFQMSKANARRHLMILLEQDSIQVIDERPVPGKGRPGRVFAASKAVLGNNLEILSAALFEKILGLPFQLPARDTITNLAECMAAMMIAEANFAVMSGVRSQSLTRRLTDLTQVLNNVHYNSRWEAHSDSPHLILGHCPYAAILDEHPQLCHLDAEIIQCLLGRPVKQKVKLAKDASGTRYCVFMVLS